MDLKEVECGDVDWITLVRGKVEGKLLYHSLTLTIVNNI
jgi:hypothetical protein